MFNKKTHTIVLFVAVVILVLKIILIYKRSMKETILDLAQTFGEMIFFFWKDRVNNDIWLGLIFDFFKFVAIRLLNQNYYNNINVHEGKSVDISCASVTGYDVGKISVKLNRIILAESDSNIVTYSFISDRQYNFKRFTCESNKMGPESTIDVHLIVECKYHNQ